ncbi:MAG: response regulator [Cellvibrionaceae bacterium]
MPRPEPKILIVDDDPLIRTSLKTMLNHEGFNNIVQSASGSVALATYYEHKADLVFLDIELQDISGFEVLDSLKTYNSAVEIVMVSGHNTIHNVKKAIDMGVQGFVVKPYKTAKIMAILKKLNYVDS